MPSPLGRVPVRVEGQTNMPINYLNLGEVHARAHFMEVPIKNYSLEQFDISKNLIT